LAIADWNDHSPIRRSAAGTRQSVDRQLALVNPSIGNRHSPIRRSATGTRQFVDRQPALANPSIGNRHSPIDNG
jgi:urease accessory protein UreE